MKAILSLAAALALTPAAVSAQDVLQARWLKSAVSQLAPELGTVAQKPPQTHAAPSEPGASAAFVGRDLSHVLRERKIPIKKVWRERKARSVPGAAQKTSQAPRAS